MADPLSSIRGRMLEDRGSGAAKSLAEYARLFPGEDALVARAYADVFGAAAISAAPSDQDTIGHYRILKELGRGGQGVVYLAEDTRLHRKVALKVLTRLGPGSEDSVHRLRREAEVASKLQHPGICGVHDAGVANGTPYIAMHYVEGTTLADRISATTPKQEIPEILRVFEKAAQALHAAHEAGIVHRDIKPGNIIVAASGQPVILDFGLARAEDMELQTLTRTGDVFGTPAYMSPEQISGQRIRLDRRSDVYSLGVTLYECLTLRRPFEAPTREGVYQAVMTKNPPDPRTINPAISKDLEVVIETALEKDRDRRYATADALARDLQAVLEGHPIQARPIGPIGRFVRWSKREPAKAVLLGVLFVALPTIATLVTSHVKDQPQVAAARLAKIEQEKDEILSEASFEISEGDPKKAVALYTQVLEMDGSSPEAAGGLVLASLKLGNPGEALRLLDLHRPLLGDGAAAHLLRADGLWALGDKEGAQTLMRTGPAPRNVFEHHLLAEKEIQNGEAGSKPAFDRALRHVTAAILLSPAPRLSLYTLRAHAAGSAKNRDAAVETAAALRKCWPDSGSAMFWCGYALGESGDPTVFDESIAASRDAIRLKPDLAFAHVNLGNVLARSGRRDEAIPELREAIRLDPNDARVHGFLGIVLQSSGLMNEAMVAFREAVRLKSNDANVHFSLGVALIDRGLIDEGIVACREAIRLKPDYAEAHCNLGASLGSVGRFRESLAELRLGHEIGSLQPGWRYPSEQWVANAQQLIDEEAELAPHVAEHVAAGTLPEGADKLVALARAALDQGQPMLAARCFEAAFAESPEFADASDAGYRRLAGRAAVLTSISGTSAPALDDAARATWRVQALVWLEAELAGMKEAASNGRATARGIRIALVPLTRSRDMASVHEPDVLAKLPDAERPRWTKLWADIDALLSSLDRKPESATPAGIR